MISGVFALFGAMGMPSTWRSSTITRLFYDENTEMLDPIHPGEILREDFLKPMGISINRLARDLDVPPNRISLILSGARAITAGYSAPPQRLFWRLSGIVAESADRLRSPRRQAGSRRTNSAPRSEAVGRLNEMLECLRVHYCRAGAERAKASELLPLN